MDTTGMPRSRKEAQAAKAAYYFTGEPCKHGHVAPRKTKGACIECIKVEWKEALTKRAAYFAEYNKSEAGQASKKRYYAANADMVKTKALGRSNEQRQVYRRAWKKTHPDEVKASTKHRRDKHKQATPPWTTLEHKQQIRQLYIDAMTVSRVTGVAYVVDHIIPLRGETVCGLHVPWNLQVITREENLKKSNSLASPPSQVYN